jgi:site-specific DNA-methyltransferase (adenine-specific)
MNDVFNENVSLKTETPAFAKHVLPAVPSSEVYLEDCVKALKRFNDNHFDLAIVDPPYGININVSIGRRKGDKKSNYHKFAGNDSSIPNEEYFDELFRVSKNQIVWGGNYMTEYLTPTPCWLLWDKGFSEDVTFAQFEMAWTSFNSSAKKYNYNAAKQQKRIHPTQKPTSLYDWILQRYAQPNDLILDTHLGSGSSRIAAYKGGFNFVGFEIDQEYYEKQEKRFNDFKSQLRLF